MKRTPFSLRSLFPMGHGQSLETALRD